MQILHYSATTTTCRMSLRECATLMERLAESDSPQVEGNPFCRQRLSEQLGDAYAVARWLREDVRLDIGHEEFRELNAALL